MARRWSSRCSRRPSCTTCTAASGCRRRGDRLSGAAQVQLSVLLGVFVLAKAVDYWLDRYDLVTSPGSLLTGITYTDDNAVLPAKNILIGIALICAVLFFLNVWRRTWLLPSMGLALLVLSAILLGLIWPGIVQQFQVKPSEADKEAPYITKNIDGHPSGLRHRGRRVDGVHRHPTRGRRRPAEPDADRAPRRSRWSTRSWCARPSSRSSRSAATTRWPTCSTSTATRSTARTGRWCSASASSTRTGSADDDQQLAQPAHRLHPRQRRDRGVRQPARPPTTRRRRHRATTSRPWAEGNDAAAGRPRPTAAGGYESRDLLRREEPRLLDRRQGVAGRVGRRARPAARRRRRTPPRPRRTTATAASPVGSMFHQLLYAVKFGEHQLPAVGPGQREHQGALQPRTRATGCRRSRPG